MSGFNPMKVGGAGGSGLTSGFGNLDGRSPQDHEALKAAGDMLRLAMKRNGMLRATALNGVLALLADEVGGGADYTQDRQP